METVPSLHSVRTGAPAPGALAPAGEGEGEGDAEALAPTWTSFLVPSSQTPTTLPLAGAEWGSSWSSGDAMPPASNLRATSERSCSQSFPAEKHGVAQHAAARAAATRVCFRRKDGCCMNDTRFLVCGGHRSVVAERPMAGAYRNSIGQAPGAPSSRRPAA